MRRVLLGAKTGYIHRLRHVVVEVQWRRVLGAVQQRNTFLLSTFVLLRHIVLFNRSTVTHATFVALDAGAQDETGGMA